jgi:hypothetical protein
MIGRSIAAAVALSLSLTATAHAATMFAGPLHPHADDESLQCSLTNVGAVTQNVTIEIYGNLLGVDGSLVGTLGPFAIAPLETVFLLEGAWAGVKYPRICKFTVPNKTLYRAVGCVYDAGFQKTCVPAQ